MSGFCLSCNMTHVPRSVMMSKKHFLKNWELHNFRARLARLDAAAGNRVARRGCRPTRGARPPRTRNGCCTGPSSSSTPTTRPSSTSTSTLAGNKNYDHLKFDPWSHWSLIILVFSVLNTGWPWWFCTTVCCHQIESCVLVQGPPRFSLIIGGKGSVRRVRAARRAQRRDTRKGSPKPPWSPWTYDQRSIVKWSKSWMIICLLTIKGI